MTNVNESSTRNDCYGGGDGGLHRYLLLSTPDQSRSLVEDPDSVWLDNQAPVPQTSQSEHVREEARKKFNGEETPRYVRGVSSVLSLLSLLSQSQRRGADPRTELVT